MGKVIDLFTEDKGGIRVSINVFDVANYFISRADKESGSFMTHLKLQKLVYYAQAWSLVWDNKPLFDEEFQAWVHGPVVPELFNRYRDCGFKPILEPDEDFDINKFTDEQIETLDAVWEAYGIYDAKYLEELTHQEDPWIMARSNCGPAERCSNIISKDSMKRFYSKFLENEQE